MSPEFMSIPGISAEAVGRADGVTSEPCSPDMSIPGICPCPSASAELVGAGELMATSPGPWSISEIPEPVDWNVTTTRTTPPSARTTTAITMVWILVGVVM